MGEELLRFFIFLREISLIEVTRESSHRVFSLLIIQKGKIGLDSNRFKSPHGQKGSAVSLPHLPPSWPHY